MVWQGHEKGSGATLTVRIKKDRCMLVTLMKSRSQILQINLEHTVVAGSNEAIPDEAARDLMVQIAEEFAAGKVAEGPPSAPRSQSSLSLSFFF